MDTVGIDTQNVSLNAHYHYHPMAICMTNKNTRSVYNASLLPAARMSTQVS